MFRLGLGCERFERDKPLDGLRVSACLHVTAETANLMRTLLQPDADPTLLPSDQMREMAELCVNCKMCRDECRAKVDIPKLMLEAMPLLDAAASLLGTDLDGLSRLALESTDLKDVGRSNHIDSWSSRWGVRGIESVGGQQLPYPVLAAVGFTGAGRD